MSETVTGAEDPWMVVERAVAHEARTRRAVQRGRWAFCALAPIAVLLVFLFHVPAESGLFFFLFVFAVWLFRKKPPIDPPLLTTLKEHPKRVVWLFARQTRDAFGLIRRELVVIGRSDGRLLELPAGSTDPKALLSALSVLAPSAEVGHSPERMELYMRHPKRPPRVRGPVAGPQLAGLPCDACGERLVIASEASACTECSVPVHRGCIAKHAMGAHAPKGVAAYR